MGSKIISSMYNQIRSKILMSGPISVAEYMRMALTLQQSGYNAKGGYYMEKDVFGQQGDFITSPEISQMFGEMLALWGITAWGEIGGPKKMSIVELGPGRGTLAKDILRVFRQLKLVEKTQLSLHLVEISTYLAQLQCNNICGTSTITKLKPFGKQIIDPFKQPSLDGNRYYYKDVSQEDKVPVYWYRDVESLPNQFHLYIAHEFFDALPVHKFQKVDSSWHEVLIDIDPKSETEKVEKFRYVVSRHETPNVALVRNYCQQLLEDDRQHLEISLEAAKVCENLVTRLDRDGGITLIIDYGHEGTKEDTFRGFYRHKVVDPLLNPGTADLTADVDFSHIIKLCKQNAMVCGPINQKKLLAFCGIDARLEALRSSCKNEKLRNDLDSGYNMLMNEMGERFKCLALFPKVIEDFRPKLKISVFDDQLKNP